MGFSIRFTESAQEELREIALYIQTYNPDKAEPFVTSIIDYYSDTLAQFPKSGILYLKDIRKLNHNKLSAFYRINETIQIIEIIHIVDLTKPLEARNIEL